MALTLGINFFLTKLLGKLNFGNFSYIINIFNLIQILFNFGIFYSISRMIALSKTLNTERELYAIGLIFTFLLYFFVIIFLIISLLFLKNNFISESILFLMPFGWIFLLNNFNELLLQGGNRIGLLSFSRFMPKFIFLLSVGYLFYFLKEETNLYSIFIYFILSSILPYIFIIYKISPKFKNLYKKFKEIKIANKEFGFNVYLGSIIAVGASSLTGIFIGYFGVNNIEVGYYHIALQFSAPLSLIPNALATSSFKNFATSKIIEKKLILILYFVSVLTLVTVIIIAKPIVLFVYGSDYIAVIDLLYFLAFGSVLYGIGDFYNRFLLANGKGKELKNISFKVGIILLVSNLFLIKYYGALGASFSTIISGLSYLILVSYKINKNNNKKKA